MHVCTYLFKILQSIIHKSWHQMDIARNIKFSKCNIKFLKPLKDVFQMTKKLITLKHQ